MSAAMPRPRKPYLHKETTRHGKTVWYVRIGDGPRTRIRAEYGSPEFEAAYQLAVTGPSQMPEPPKKSSGTIAWAIGLSRNSKAWSDLSSATRRQRGCILRKIEVTEGASPFKDITAATIKAGVKRRASTPAAARHFLHTMKGLFAWAVGEDLADADPTFGIVARAAKTEGHPTWTDADIEAYEARWPLGTRERVAFDVLLYAGLRRGDAVVVGKQHVKNGVIRLSTEKTKEPVAIVVCSELALSIPAGPCGDLTFIAGEKGRPRVKASFGEWFREACRAAGVRKSAHGLRTAAATRAANNQATESELDAMFGWRGGRMAALYTRAANRERLAIRAGDKLSRSKS